METGYGYSYALNQVGGVTDLPCFIYSNLPLTVGATTINLTGGAVNSTNVVGRVVVQITGNSVGGTNINFPGV